MAGVRSGKTERRQSICYDIRGRRQVFTGCSSEVHDAFNTVHHVAGLPARHGHVLKGRRGFCRGELGLGSHLTGFVPEVLQVAPSRSGDSRHFGHALIKIRCSFDCRRPEAHDGSRHMSGQGLSHGGDLLTDLLELAPDLFDFGKSGIGRRRLGFQGFQLLLCFLYLALERIVLLLGDFPFLQLFVCLLYP